MNRTSAQRMPSLWQALCWAVQPNSRGGGTTRARLAWRTAKATVTESKALRRWMTVVYELHSRQIVRDIPSEYLRAMRPHVHRSTSVAERVVQLTDHMDWLETAFHTEGFERIASGKPLVLAELAAPRGYDFMRLQLQQAPPQSPEGELLLTLTLQRSAVVQHKPQPVAAGVLAFSWFRIEGVGCLVIGGVRGQRHPVQRLSPMEISQALQSWKPAVLLVRVAQELALHWGLRLVGLDPAAHRLHGWSYRWNSRHRAGGQRIFDSYEALWSHFDATPGADGWMIIPLNSDDKLAATALSPEKRERQTRRADYWMRTRSLLRAQFKPLLARPNRLGSPSGHTQAMERESVQGEDDVRYDFPESEGMGRSHVFESMPASLL